MKKITASKNYLIALYPNRGITFTKGDGVYLYDQNGEKYLDLGSNYGVNIFGYNHPPITKALQRQLNDLVNLHGSFNNQVRTQAAENLLKATNGRLSRIFFSNSGAEAIEAALKFARVATGKSHFIAMKNAYHGKTLGALSATAGERYRNPFLPLLWDFTHVSFGNIEELQCSISNNTAAIMIEPVQGEGGIHVAPPEFYSELQHICLRRKILLIVDEIQTGVGRTGTFLAGEQFGLKPDILCLGKGIAGGIPIGVTLVTKEISSKIPLHIHTTTFGGNPLACAGILAVLKELENGKVFDEVKKLGMYFRDQLKSIDHPNIIEVRGLGLMIGMELEGNATPVLRALQQERIIALPAGSNIVRFLPPLTITKTELDKAISVLKRIYS
jgi:acetylornithine/LysW-gamma-L-lysine aminotransferase